MDIPSWNRGWENHVREGKGKRGLESTSKCLICLVSHNRQLWRQVLGGPNVKISRGSPSSSFVFMSQPLWFLVIFTFLSSCFTLPPRSVGSTKRNYMGWKEKQVWGFILHPGCLNLLKILFSTLTHSLVVLAKKLSSTADMGLNSYAVPRLSLSSDAYQIVIKTEERELLLPLMPLRRLALYYLSLIITNELTSIPPLDSNFGPEM